MSDKKIYEDSEFSVWAEKGVSGFVRTFFYNKDDNDHSASHMPILDIPGELTRAQCAGVAELLAKIKELERGTNG